MVVLYLMTSLPPIPKIELDDEKEKREKKRQIYGSALVPSMEALCLFKEQLASSRDVLTVCARMTPPCTAHCQCMLVCNGRWHARLLLTRASGPAAGAYRGLSRSS